MAELKKILIVDSNEINRANIKNIISDSYITIEACSSKNALEILNKKDSWIDVVILDLLISESDGFELLKIMQKDSMLCNIPVIAVTDATDTESEDMALDLGAWDLISVPYDEKVVKFRLNNVLLRSQFSIFDKLKYLSEYDSLTELYNKKKFYESSKKLLEEGSDKSFIMVRFDIDRFQLINSFYGSDEGDNLLKYIASGLRNFASGYKHIAYGRIEADVFAFVLECLPDKQRIETVIEAAKKYAMAYMTNFNITLTFGICIITDKTLPVNILFDRATLAARSVKGNYIHNFAFYSDKMSKKLETEQEIVNEMNTALEQGQFVVYYQPKYNVKTNMPSGAEALVRWAHPVKGMISPGDFIPVFERNGFISKLDQYVWEEVCRNIRKWMDNGISPYPISVNISCVNLYNPKLVDNLCELTDKYQIPRELLQLELTETFYTEKSTLISNTVERMCKENFSVLMDDFGSGYSSLNALKDIPIDILKIDMGFFKESSIKGRAENIVAAVIRMAKWLGLSVIAEGVEKSEQVDFLREIGCEYIQGFYYARPMPLEQYEKLMSSTEAFHNEKKQISDYSSLWASNPQMEFLFTGISQPVAIYEIEGDIIEIIRSNDAYNKLFGYKNSDMLMTNPLNVIRSVYRQTIINTIEIAAETKSSAECEYQKLASDNTMKWIRISFKYITNVGSKCIMLGTLTDISTQKEIELELNKYKTALDDSDTLVNKILIIDNQKNNRLMLSEIFAEQFTVFQVESVDQGFDFLSKNPVNAILLNVYMPEEDVKRFFAEKQIDLSLNEIPTIIITSASSSKQQVTMLNLGAEDYIVKPFVKEIVLKRVKNVLKANKRLHQYQNIKDSSQVDLLTGLWNRVSAAKFIEKRLSEPDGRPYAMLMLDIDHFEAVNDRYGWDCGDELLKEISEQMIKYWEEDDIVSRFGGDKFCVFTNSFETQEQILEKASKFCNLISNYKFLSGTIDMSLSVGIAIADNDLGTIDILNRQADMALKESKIAGKNRAAMFKQTVLTV